MDALSALGQTPLRRSVIDPVTGNPLVTSAPTGEVRQRSALLPLGRDDDGRLVPAVPQGLFDMIDAARAPGRALSGDLQVFDPSTGHVSDNAMGAANGLAALAMTGGLGGAAVKAGETALGAGPIRAYHGSPHGFDRFDLSKIGTGEGAQAYGHGLYFAENEATARQYRDVLSGQPKPYLDGKPFAGDVMQPRTPEDLAATVMGAAGGDRAMAAQHLDTMLGYLPEHAPHADAVRDLLASGRVDYRADPGHMYEVGIKATPRSLLDYDVPIGAQSAAVQRFAKRARVEPETLQYVHADPAVGRYGSGYDMAPTRGGDLIDALTRRGYDPAELSQDMRKAGVPGIRYFDRDSRTVGDGTRNYITFSDDIVSILRKYGLAGAAGAGGAAAAFGQPGDASANGLSALGER